MSKLKPNELRIGNYALFAKDMVGTAVTIENSVCRFSTNDGLPDCYSGFKDINPIPLTEQRLKDFGFELKGKTFVKYMKPDFIFEIMKAGTHWFPEIIQRGELSHEEDNHIFLNFIDYAHQLQNLYFALTGEELKTK